MKRLMLVLVALLGLAHSGQAGSTIRSTCRDSQLCLNLGALLQFEEASDNTRLDSYGFSDFFEPDGADIPNTVSGKFGNALSLNGTSQYLYVPEGAPTVTIAVWVFQSSTTGIQTILGQYGTYDLRMNAGKPELVVYKATDDSSITLTWGVALSASTWHLIVVTPRFATDASGNPYVKLGMRADNGTAIFTAVITDPLKGHALRKLAIGAIESSTSGTFIQFFNGRIDHMLFAGRAWTPQDESLYYNSGTGRSYPFSTLP